MKLIIDNNLTIIFSFGVQPGQLLRTPEEEDEDVVVLVWGRMIMGFSGLSLVLNKEGL